MLSKKRKIIVIVNYHENSQQSEQCQVCVRRTHFCIYVGRSERRIFDIILSDCTEAFHGINQNEPSHFSIKFLKPVQRMYQTVFHLYAKILDTKDTFWVCYFFSFLFHLLFRSVSFFFSLPFWCCCSFWILHLRLTLTGWASQITSVLTHTQCAHSIAQCVCFGRSSSNARNPTVVYLLCTICIFISLHINTDYNGIFPFGSCLSFRTLDAIETECIRKWTACK